MKLAPALLALFAALSMAFVAAYASLLFTGGLPIGIPPLDLFINAGPRGSWALWAAWALIFLVAMPRLYRRLSRRFGPKVNGARHAT